MQPKDTLKQLEQVKGDSNSSLITLSLPKNYSCL